MGKELTQQQENFCKLYVKYGIGYKAYIEAYPKAKTWARNSIDCACSKMLANAKIKQRINDLNAKIESTLETSLNLNKRKILEEIIELQQKAKSEAGQGTVNLQALKLLSQIAGLLQENKTEININNNMNVAEVSNFLDL